jgi:hypothetical protein
MKQRDKANGHRISFCVGHTDLEGFHGSAGDVMNFRSWTQKRVKFNNCVLRKRLSSGLWRRVVWQKCTEAANWDSRMQRNVGTFVTDNTASVRRDMMLHMSILRPREPSKPQISIQWHRIIMDHSGYYSEHDVEVQRHEDYCALIYIYIYIYRERERERGGGERELVFV